MPRLVPWICEGRAHGMPNPFLTTERLAMQVPPSALGAIHAEAVYPLAEFQRLTGLGEAAMREARRKGLAICTIGRRRFVRGADFHDHVRLLANRTTEAAGGGVR